MVLKARRTVCSSYRRVMEKERCRLQRLRHHDTDTNAESPLSAPLKQARRQISALMGKTWSSDRARSFFEHVE